MNLGSPDLIDKYKVLPFDGIGLMRLEFLIADKISKHPLKLIEDNESDKFVNELFNGIHKVASTIFSTTSRCTFLAISNLMSIVNLKAETNMNHMKKIQ